MAEFRFYCDEWTSGSGTPSKWKAVDASSFTDVINRYYSDEIRVYDADNGGEDVYYFGVTDGVTTKYYRLAHDWYIDWDPDWNIYNNKEIVEIAHSEAVGIPGDRDWVELRQTSYPEVKKWPPMALGDW